MKNKNIIQNCFTAIMNNFNTSHQLDNELYVHRDFSSWCELLKKRSLNIKEIFGENSKTVSEIVSYLKNDLDDEIAAALYEGYRAMEEAEMHDSRFLLDIINKLVPFYEEKNDFNRLIHLYTDRCYELSAFLRLDTFDLVRMHADLYKIVALKKYYKEFNSVKERRLIFIGYYNIIRTLPGYNEKYSDDILPIFREARAFYNSDCIKEMKDEDLAREEKNLFNIMFLHSFMYYLDEGLYQQMEYVDLIDEIKDTFEDEMDTDLCNAVLNYFHDQMNDTEFFYYLRKYFEFYYEEANKLRFDESTDHIFVTTENMLNTAYMIYDFLKHSYLSYEEQKEYAAYITDCVVGFIKKVPARRFNVFFDESCATIFRKALPFLATPDQKEELLTQVILKQQTLNYVHSRMVEKISLAILDSIHEVRDNLLDEFMAVGFKDYQDLRGYVARGARIHDLGKSLSLGVINQQLRGLSEAEHKYIKLHPSKGDEIINNDVDLEYYHDIMLGHHKTYDGKEGYPKEFDNTKSKYRIIIDLISIADSLDAATDLYGRNYHEGKNFDIVLEELNKGAGTQYNPRLVLYISSNKDIDKKLREIVSDGRLSLYYDTYFK